MKHFTRTKWGFETTLGNAPMTVEYYNDAEGIGRCDIFFGSNSMKLRASHASDRDLMYAIGIPMGDNRILCQIGTEGSYDE